ncbi:MAG TPA: hypothetical protein VE775_09550, partial [Pyrinomonadaceae bacterium]|nr:hypothetical protein [Pyrinomonadaceae bacterium]
IGLKIARHMGQSFDGDAAKIRRASATTVARALGLSTDKWRAAEQRAFADLALMLALIPDLARWSPAEKRAVVRVVRAKAGVDELDYLRRLQQHARLRRAIIELGTSRAPLNQDDESNEA